MNEAKYRLWDIFLKTIGGLGFLTTLAWSSFIFTQTKDHDFRKEYYSAQTKVYFESCEVASKISLAANLHKPDIIIARERYWELYYGSFNIVADSSVNSCMIDYGKILAQCERGELKNIDTLQYYSLALSHSCRESLGKSWDVSLSLIKGRYNHIYKLD